MIGTLRTMMLDVPDARRLAAYCGRGGGAAARRHLTVLRRRELAGPRRPGRQAVLLGLDAGPLNRAARHSSVRASGQPWGTPFRTGTVGSTLVVPSDEGTFPAFEIVAVRPLEADVWHC